MDRFNIRCERISSQARAAVMVPVEESREWLLWGFEFERPNVATC